MNYNYQEQHIAFLKGKLGTPEGRRRLLEIFSDLKEERALCPQELQILDHAQNWDRYLEDLKQNIIASERILKNLEDQVFGSNVIPFRKPKR